MSVRVMTKVFEHSESVLAARLVLLAIADAAGDDGVTWVGQEEIASKARVHVDTVGRAVRDLKRDGEIEVRVAQRKRRRINVYRVQVPELKAVDYEKLPFEIKTPFTTRQFAGPPIDDPANDHLTTRQSAGSPIGREPSIEPSLDAAHPSADLSKPPSLVKVDGRNVALDALCKATGVDPGSPRFIQAVVAMNGRVDERTKELKDPGIVHLFWKECVRYAEESGEHDRLTTAHELPARFCEALAGRIERKAQTYRDRMGNATLTPKALRDWWLDLELTRAPDRGMSSDEMRNFEDAA